MKKLSLAITAFTMLFFISCKEEAKEPVVNEITIEQPAADSTAVAPAKEEEGTKLKVNSEGVEYSDGKTSVEVSKDGAEASKK